MLSLYFLVEKIVTFIVLCKHSGVEEALVRRIWRAMSPLQLKRGCGRHIMVLLRILPLKTVNFSMSFKLS